MQAMCAVLGHRGPEGTHFHSEPGAVLGHTRLVIIDPTERSDQPMAAGTRVLIYNGEVYNYRELREELRMLGRTFRSDGDTEVVLQAYAQWGPAALERFNGMFAFAIWDSEKRSLFIARDRFGVKPLYYRWDGTTFAFASEIKALLAASDAPVEPEDAVVLDYLAYAAVDHRPETFFKGIRRLDAGAWLRLEDGRLEERRWWKLESLDEDVAALPASERDERFRDLFVDSVRLRLRSDVPVGTCLSGGLDSSSIVGVVNHLLRDERESAHAVGERQKTFSVAYGGEGIDESRYREAVIARTGVDAHSVSPDPGEVMESLDAVIAAQDEPFGSTSIVAQWHVMRLAKERGVTVLLDGQGADEILAGYHGYFAFRLGDLVRTGRLREWARELSGYRENHHPGLRRMGEQIIRPFVPLTFVERGGRVTRRDLPRVQEAQRPRPPTNDFPDQFRRQLLHVLAGNGLPSLLRYEDRNSMASSIEARVPFLDYRLVRYAFSLPPEDLIREGTTKVILRRALGGFLPPEVAARQDKIGFATPERDWLTGPLREPAREILRSRSFADRGYVDPQRALDRFEKVVAGRAKFDFGIWRWLNLELWMRRYVDRSAVDVSA